MNLESKLEFDYDPGSRKLTLHIRAKLELFQEKRLIKRTRFGNIESVEVIIDGIEAFSRVSSYCLEFQIAKLYNNQEDLKDIQNQIIDYMGLLEDCNWIKEAYNLDYEEIKREQAAVEVAEILREETDLALELCMITLKRSGYKYEVALAKLNNYKNAK